MMGRTWRKHPRAVREEEAGRSKEED